MPGAGLFSGVAVAGVAGSYLPLGAGRVMTVLLACGVAGIYVVVLVATRELTRADVAAVRAVGGR